MTDRQIGQLRETERQEGRGVLITGCTGFIGAHLTRELLAKGYRVYAIVRDRDKLLRTVGDRDRLTILQADLLREQDLKQLRHELRSTVLDFVIHTVGGGPLTSNARFASAISDLNYETTVTLVRALEEAGKLESVSALVYYSSLAAMGVPNNSGTTVVYSETTACNPVLPYEQAKFRTEEFLKTLATKHKFKVVVLRLPQIYGQDDDPFMQMIGLIRKGVFPVVRNGFGTLPLLHVGDATKATCRILEDVSKIRKNYDVNLICENSYSYRCLEQLVKRKYGTARILSVPYSAMYLAVLGIETLFKLWGRPEPLNRRRLASMTKNRIVDCGKFMEKFTFQFDHTVEKFLADGTR